MRVADLRHSFDDDHAGYGIRLGTVRQRDQLAPKQQIWTRSAMPWLAGLASIPASESEPED